MDDLDLSVRVLVHRERVDHTHGVARAQPFQLLDDLTVKLRVAEAQDDQLHWSNCHIATSRGSLELSLGTMADAWLESPHPQGMNTAG